MDLHSILPSLAEGAENLMDYAAVKAGEEVLILTEDSDLVDKDVLQAIELAAKGRRADVSVLVARKFHPKFDTPPRVVEHAMYNADVVFALIKDPVFTHSRVGVKAMLDYDVRIYAIADIRREFFENDFAKFPNEVFWAIARKVYGALRQGKRFHITSGNGTDISGEIHPLHITGISRNIEPAPGLPGAFNVWPGGVCETHPEGIVSGRVVYDQLDGFGLLHEPVVLTITDHWVTNIEGQTDAVEWLKEKAYSIKNGNYFAEVSTGLNPKASIHRGLERGSFELTRRAGTCHFGIGKSTTIGGRVWSNFHWDGLIFKPNYYVGDFCLVREGHLTILDDPEIRTLAAKYGDPDKVLAYVDTID